MTPWPRPTDPSTGNVTMMMHKHDSDPHDAVGAYAVGALEPDQAAEFEDHLAVCEYCAEELVGLTSFLRALAPLADEMVREAAPAEERQGAVVRIDSFRSRRRGDQYANTGSPSWEALRSRLNPRGAEETRLTGTPINPWSRGTAAASRKP